MTELPAYDDLPEGPSGGRLAWHLFGADDQLGLLNLLTEERVREAASLVRAGKTFPLDHSLTYYRPAVNHDRATPTHRLLAMKGGYAFDDVLDGFYPQGGSQWDALAHVGYDTDQFYNGTTSEQIRSQGRLSIEAYAQRGVVARAVVLDMPATLAAAGIDYDPGSTHTFSVADLQAAAAHGGVEHRVGDIILLYTGFEDWYAQQPQSVRDELPQQLATPGIEQSEDMARYLWNLHAAGIASDNYSVEAWPPRWGKAHRPFGFLHQMLIGSFGMAIGELWHLSDLVADCRADGVYEGMLASAPLNSPGGVGSPANTLLLK